MSDSINSNYEKLISLIPEQTFKDLYVTEQEIQNQKKRYLNAIEKFEKNFGKSKVHLYSSPGFSNIAGFSDLHKGVYAAVNRDILGIVSKRDDNTIKIISDDVVSLTISLINLEIYDDEIGYPTEMLKKLISKAKENNIKCGGLNCFFSFNIPHKIGFSDDCAFYNLIVSIIINEYNGGNIADEKLSSLYESLTFNYLAGINGGISFIDKSNRINAKHFQLDLSKTDYVFCIINTKKNDFDDAGYKNQTNCCMNNIVLSELNEDFCLPEDKFIEKLIEYRKTYDEKTMLNAIQLYKENKIIEYIIKSLEEEDFNKFLHYSYLSGKNSYDRFFRDRKDLNIQFDSILLAMNICNQILYENPFSSCRFFEDENEGAFSLFLPRSKVEDVTNLITKFYGTGKTYILYLRNSGAVKII